MEKCIFCEIVNGKEEHLFENELAVAFLDKNPVSKGHTLIIPRRHVDSFFDITDEEISAMHDLALEVKQYLDELYAPNGFNIGFNVGEAGGQSVFHCHMHVIPRYNGDVVHPRGGIRKVLKK